MSRLVALLAGWVAVFALLMGAVAACQPNDDSGTDGRVDPTCEAETDRECG